MTHEEKLRQAQEAVNSAAVESGKGRFRQHYHFMAPTGWINDPNGFIYYNNEYHLFYQHNPYAAVWGAMHWGHAVSRDLVQWQHEPIVLAPSEKYDDHPKGGVFSGSTIEYGEALAALYTATTNYGNGFVQSQCLAFSNDGGRSFQKYEANPVIASPPPKTSSDFRDPRVIQHGDFWYMVLGASLGNGAWYGGEGCAHLYKSRNLKAWEYCGIVARSEGHFGTMWECPDLFPLDGKWILTCSPMFMENRKTVYFVGRMDFEAPRFIIERDGEIDWGMEYYASQSLLDNKGRRILIAWQNGWDWMPWWKDFGPTRQERWCGCMTLPRSVSLDKQNRLVSVPVKELETLRRDKKESQNLVIGKKKTTIPCADNVCFELFIEIDLKKTSAQMFYLLLRASGKKATVIKVDFIHKKLIFDRNNADEGYSTGVRECGLLFEDSVFYLRIFSDIMSIELFTDGGRVNMSNTIYPTHLEQHTYCYAEGGEVFITKINAWSIE
jgi:beta-fructofuranosidase